MRYDDQEQRRLRELGLTKIAIDSLGREFSLTGDAVSSVLNEEIDEAGEGRASDQMFPGRTCAESTEMGFDGI